MQNYYFFSHKLNGKVPTFQKNPIFSKIGKTRWNQSRIDEKSSICYKLEEKVKRFILKTDLGICFAP